MYLLTFQFPVNEHPIFILQEFDNDEDFLEFVEKEIRIKRLHENSYAKINKKC